MTYNEARACKNAKDLPMEYQEELARLRSNLRDENTPYSVTLYNNSGRLAFIARRCQRSWEDHRTGNYMPFGGGSYWTIACVPVQWRPRKDVLGNGFTLELCNGKRYGKYGDGKVIPTELATKAEVLALARDMGLFNI